MSGPTKASLRELLRQRLDLVVSSITGYAIIMLDRERCIVTWNTGAERILGYREEEAVKVATRTTRKSITAAPAGEIMSGCPSCPSR